MDPLRKRFFVNGEPAAGSTLHAEYLKPAKILLDTVKQRMQLGSLQQLAQRYTTEDGATITAMSRFGQDEIRIDVPQGGGIEPRIVEYCVVGPDHEWLSPEIFQFVMNHAVILMDRRENYAYAAQVIPSTQGRPNNTRAKLTVFDVQLNVVGEIPIPPPVQNNVVSRVMHYDARNDVFALTLEDWLHAEFPEGWASGSYSYPVIYWPPGATDYTVWAPEPVSGGTLLNEEGGSNSHEGGSFYVEQGQGAEPDLVVASDSFSVIGTVPDAVRFTHVSSKRGDWLAFVPNLDSFDPETLLYDGVTAAVVNASGVDWAEGLTLPSNTLPRFAFNNAVTRLFYLDSLTSVTIKGESVSKSLTISQYGTPRELLHDPVTDAVAVCFSHVGALILNAHDCMGMPIPPFFHEFKTIPAGQDEDGEPVPVRFTQFMHGSLLGRVQSGLNAIFCKIDIGRLHQTKITEPRP